MLFFDRFLKGKAEFSGFNLRDKWGCATTSSWARGRARVKVARNKVVCYKIGNFSKTARRRPREKHVAQSTSRNENR